MEFIIYFMPLNSILLNQFVLLSSQDLGGIFPFSLKQSGEQKNAECSILKFLSRLQQCCVDILRNVVEESSKDAKLNRNSLRVFYNV